MDSPAATPLIIAKKQSAACSALAAELYANARNAKKWFDSHRARY
jgi:hypothetical protein